MSRPTTGKDIIKLRALAARGVVLATAAHEVGLSREQVAYWNERLSIGLPVIDAGYRLGVAHPAPDIYACWTLHRTMCRMREFIDGTESNDHAVDATR